MISPPHLLDIFLPLHFIFIFHTPICVELHFIFLLAFLDHTFAVFRLRPNIGSDIYYNFEPNLFFIYIKVNKYERLKNSKPSQR